MMSSARCGETTGASLTLSQTAGPSRLARKATRGEAMKVLVAGATGALGKQLVPKLVVRRHDVVGMTRSPEKQDTLRALGARPAVADALDPDQVARAVAES